MIIHIDRRLFCYNVRIKRRFLFWRHFDLKGKTCRMKKISTVMSTFTVVTLSLLFSVVCMAASDPCGHLSSKYPLMSMRLRAGDTATKDVWKSVFKAVSDNPGCCDEIWFSTGIGLDIMDMPGILWPKFEDRTVGENLALTGAIKDDVVQIEELAMAYCNRMKSFYPDLLATRYKLGEVETFVDMSDYDLLCYIGKKRGFLISGGEINTERAADMLLDEFRAAKLGRITLDRI